MDFSRIVTDLAQTLSTPRAWVGAWAVVTLVVALRYVALGLVAEMFYARTARTGGGRRVGNVPPVRRRLAEAGWSLASSALFGLGGCALARAWIDGDLKVYYDLDRFGWWYLPFSWFVYAALHDAAYYFAHRLMHHPRLYRHVHAVHHRSRDPSAWASFAFHPWETALQMAILPALLLVIPIHPYVFLAHLVLMSLTAVTNHSGFEVLPRGTIGRRLAGVVVSGAHHARHHRTASRNFGLFFTWWDHWLGTEHPGFDADRDRLFGSSRSGKTARPDRSISRDLGHTEEMDLHSR